MQDKGSKIPCVMFGTVKIIQSDHLHQERGSVGDEGAKARQQEHTGGKARTLAQSHSQSVNN